MTEISIIVCTRNRPASLRRTLWALDEVVMPSGVGVECLVVDNTVEGSTCDLLGDVQLQNLRLRFIQQPDGAKANAINRGLRHADGRVIVSTDDDVIPDANWLVGITAPLLARECHAVCGGIQLAPALLRPWMTRTHRGWLASSEWFEGGHEGLVGASMAFVRDVLLRVPEFDPELGPGALGYGEDTLFFLQLKEAGYSIVKRLDAFVWHHPDADRLTRDNWLALAERMGRSQAYIDYHWRHSSPRVPHIRQSLLRSRLAVRRLLRPFEIAGVEGAPPWELLMVSRCSYWRQVRIEKRRPRNYVKHGLTRLAKQTSS